MKKLIFSVALATLINPLLASDIFENGQKFCRTQMNSPIYLEKSSDIILKNYGLPLLGGSAFKRSGFRIFTRDKKEEVGYITVNNDTPKFIELAFIFIEGKERKKGYATEAMRTIEGIYKAHGKKIPNATHFSISVDNTNKAMMQVCQKLDYKKTTEIFSPSFMTAMIKAIQKD